MTDGLAVVDKPAGMTSHDVVGRCRKIFGQRRVGHAGTLDPDATGVLLVGLGQATRLMQFMSGLPKSYAGEVVCGLTTSTLDESGEVTGRWDMAGVALDDARRVAATLTGTIDQVPPMVSAIKIGGRRLHQLAREGVEVDRPARRVTITRFDVTPAGATGPVPDGAGPVWAVTVDCSAGTYVRSLAADLGAGLGGGAHLRALRRTAVGPWSLDDAVALDALGPGDVLPPAAAVPTLARRRVDAALGGRVRHGAVLGRTELDLAGPGPWALLAPDGALLAVYGAFDDDKVKPMVVLNQPDGGTGPDSVTAR
jgi:tRNA pseudouridine55 synthase